MCERRTKRQQVVDALRAGDLNTALRTARSFRRDFSPEDQATITRAAEFDLSSVYAQLGHERTELRQKAEVLLRKQYLNEEHDDA